MSVIDQYKDPVFAVLIKAVDGRPKLAAAIGDFDVEPSEAESLPDTAFAWPEKRAYPIHSREHAILSRTYREAVGGPLPLYVDRSIKEACDIYEIDDAIFARETTKVARDDANDYLLPDAKKLRVVEASQVKTAEAKLINEGSKLTPGSRMLASARLVEKAAMLGVSVKDITRKMAGLTLTSTRELADWLEARAEAADLPYKAGYQKLAAEAKSLPATLRDRNVQMKLAIALEELDEIAGLDRHWGRKLPDPMATVFNTTKVAGSGVMLAGRFVPMERMAAYPTSFYSDVLGDDIVREASDVGGGLDLHKLAAVLGTLPVDMQRVLIKQMG